MGGPIDMRSARSRPGRAGVRALAAAVLMLFAVMLLAMGEVRAAGSNGYVTIEGAILCDFKWQDARTIASVEIMASKRCKPDNPDLVAAVVAGTNNVPAGVLKRSNLDPGAVLKSNDRDGDGDPDEIHITLEIMGLGEYPSIMPKNDPFQEIAPRIRPAFWVFAPKGTGTVSNGSPNETLISVPSPTIRVEVGDTMYVTVENTHYLPHTIHFHGVDHPFEMDSEGNDGVPQTSEMPIMPGETRTYEFSPRHAGTMFYHCHVVPNVHVAMGLNGMFVVEENRPNNSLETLNIAAGEVRHPSVWIREQGYAGEYDLVYQSIDKELHEISKNYNDTRELARQFNRVYDVTDATQDYFLLNGRSFPYTILDSVITVEQGKLYRLRLLNSGSHTISMHTHGHKFIIEAYDGVELAEGQRIQRDVLTLTTAQRVDLTLNTTNDGLDSYGPGVWLFHDHREAGITNDGISPGGTVSMIVYDKYLTPEGFPATKTDLGQFFFKEYYMGQVPFWEMLDEDAFGRPPDEPLPEEEPYVPFGIATDPRTDIRRTPDGMVVNEFTGDDLPVGCSEISADREVTIHGGRDYAGPGQMFSYSETQFNWGKCERVKITFVNEDEVRHQFMIHGFPAISPEGELVMGKFTLEARDHGSVTGTFITPADDITLMMVHCSLPEHEQKGMRATITIGAGGPGMMDMPGMDMNMPGMEMDMPGMRMDAPGQSGGSPGQDMEMPGMEMDMPGMDMDAPDEDVGSPEQGMDMPGMDMDMPEDAPEDMQHMDMEDMNMEQPGEDGGSQADLQLKNALTLLAVVALAGIFVAVWPRL